MSNLKNRLKNVTERSYLARDYSGFRNELIQHAKIFYPDKIRDFSEPGLGSLLIDMASMVGDTMSYYMDHQFRELNPLTAVEPENVAMHARNVGITATGAAAASGMCNLTFVVPAVYLEVPGSSTLQPRPKLDLLPVVMAGTTFLSSLDGISYKTTEDVDFSQKDTKGEFIAKYSIGEVEDSKVKNFIVTREVEVVSGEVTSESFVMSADHDPFRTITLSNPDCTEIMSVFDSESNEYYQVDSLNQDTVYIEVDNLDARDRDDVSKTLEVISAPRRFIKRVSTTNYTTSLTFGGGDSQALDDDLAPDPADLALSLFGKKNFSRFSIDPNTLLNTQTLGLAPRSTTIIVTYRYGGGLKHNAPSLTINEIATLSIEFRRNPVPREALLVRQSARVINTEPVSGAANRLDIGQLRELIPIARNSQERIVTRQDLLARLYTLPTKFGKLYRAGISINPTNNLSVVIHVIGKDRDGQLAICPDTFKMNLSKYINEYRLISDAFDIVDAKILNFQVKYEVFLNKTVNKLATLNTVNRAIARMLDRRMFTIDQPIIIDGIFNAISRVTGVISINDLQILPVFGTAVDGTVSEEIGLGPGDRVYSTADFNTSSSVKGGILRGDLGSIFELRYPEHDIIGYAV